MNRTPCYERGGQLSPVVSLDVLPADVPAEYAPAMVSACSDALAEGRCAMAASLPESTRPEAVALVLWQGDGFLRVTVRVGRGGGQWVARALNFSERDSISERWTTVGLTVATLVGETRALDAKAHEPAPQPVASDGLDPVAPPPRDPSSAPPRGPVPAPPPAVRPPAAPPVAPNAAGAPPSWRGRLGALAGPGWDDGGWRLGSWLSLGFVIPGTPLVVDAVGSYALSDGPSVRSRGLSTRWLSVGAGFGATGVWSALDLAGSAAIEVAYRRVDVDIAGGSASAQDVPVSLRALGSFPARGPLAATAGLVMRLPPQNSKDSGDLRLSGPAFAAEVVAGLEVRL